MTPTSAAYLKLPLGSVRPEGWLLDLLNRQLGGLTGHIRDSGYPFDTCLWAGEKMEGSPTAWWPYEQTAYYLDGAVRLAHLLGSDTPGTGELMQLVRSNHQWVRDHLRADGRFGTVLTERWRHWPYASFARSVMAEYEATGEASLVELLHRHYLTFEAADFADVLELANVEALLWVHGRTGDTRLLALAEEAYQLFVTTPAYREWFNCDLDFAGDEPPTTHGVVYLELLKIPALLYAATGKVNYLAAATNGARTMEAHSLLVSGLPSSTEHFEDRGEACGHETCNTAVFPYTYGTLLRVTGDAAYADHIERAVFNAGLGSVTKDFATHQYFSAPNQPLVGADANPYGHHPARLAYQKAHDVQCCTGNINRFLPYFTEQLWMGDSNGGLTAALYAPCTVTTRVGEGDSVATITMRERTDYPFGDTVRLELSLGAPISFPLRLRIPAWCAHATLMQNGDRVDAPLTAGTFALLEREFHDGDVLELTLPRQVTTSSWPHGGTAFEYGPLVFSLPVGPGQPWNVALEPPSSPPPALFKPLPPAGAPENGNPWDLATSPLKLQVQARLLPAWKPVTKLDPRHGQNVTTTLGFPKNRRTKGKPMTLMLVPYGCTTARVTVFP